MIIIDYLFGHFRLYRKFRGGEWCKIELEDGIISQVHFMWLPKKHVSKRSVVIDTEVY